MAAAAAAVGDVRGGRQLPESLARRTAALPPASRTAARDIAYQTVRQLGRLEALAALLNVRAPPPTLAALQLVALGQLLEPLRSPAVIVDQAVAAARESAPGTRSRAARGAIREATGHASRGVGRGNQSARGPAADSPGARAAGGFLNATLRRFEREAAALLARVDQDPAARLSYPAWWLQRLHDAYPDRWEAVAQAGNAQAPLTLRVNRRRTTLEAQRARLAAQGMASTPAGPDALVLVRAVPVEQIPGFDAGDVSVQDAGAQMAAHLLGLADGQRVLDACAAPGGKACHLLQLADIDLLALDIDAGRCRRIEQNLAREGWRSDGQGPLPRAVVRTGDVLRTGDWWDGRPFDRILLDAPCSASGIVRRHPDVRWLRRRGDLATLAARQRQMLDALWPLLAPGGKLLYANCSVFPEEGEGVVGRFGADRADCVREPLVWEFPDGQREAVSQLLPVCARQDGASALREHDGFFYACLSKRQ